MNISTPQYFPVTVDLYLPKPQPIVNAQQNDSGRGLQITLTGNGNVLVPGSEVINLYAQKPDGTISYLPCTVSGNYILCEFTNQMLAVAGFVQIQLQIIFPGESGATATLSTTVCTVNVLSSIIDQDAIESSNEFTALENALAEVEYLKENGLKGDAATIEVGTTTTGAPGTQASVTNSGTTGAAVFNFTIPRGQDGAMWYYGTGITGTSTSGTIFSGSGVASANVGDKFLNVGTDANKGNVYTCTVAGNASTAQWAYIGSVLGPQGPEGPAGMQEITFGAKGTYPTVGNANMLYIDNTVSPVALYLFNTTLNQYVPINQGGIEFTDSGSTISLQNLQVVKSFRSLKVYGRSTQNGTPSPESPVPIVTAGSGGTINITISDSGSNSQTFPISTPNGLPGIPVESGGNYTDESGQQRIADVKDYGTGKYTQNCATIVFDGSEDENWNINVTEQGVYQYFSNNVIENAKPNSIVISNAFQSSDLSIKDNNCFISASKKISFFTSQITTLQDFKEKVLTLGVTVLYQLSTPVVTDIPAEEMEAYKALTTYTPTTVISSDSGVWLEADLVDSDILYPSSANISYDNSTSGLNSTNVQGAIDENAENIAKMQDEINTVFSSGNVQNSVDYNSLPSGVFYMGTGCANAPEGYCRVMCLYTNNNASLDGIQVAFSISNAKIYMRSCNSGTWGAWNLFSGSPA